MVSQTPLQMKEKLIESFSDHVLEYLLIELVLAFLKAGIWLGKKWIVSLDDLEIMYKELDPGSEISL